jgi:hypothetical protein
MPAAKIAQETSCEQPAKRVSKKLVRFCSYVLDAVLEK